MLLQKYISQYHKAYAVYFINAKVTPLRKYTSQKIVSWHYVEWYSLTHDGYVRVFYDWWTLALSHCIDSIKQNIYCRMECKIHLKTADQFYHKVWWEKPARKFRYRLKPHEFYKLYLKFWANELASSSNRTLLCLWRRLFRNRVMKCWSKSMRFIWVPTFPV